MKNSILLLFAILFTATMQSQDRSKPKAGKSPIVNIKKPQTFVMPNGLKVMVVEDHKLPRVSFNLTIDNLPFAEGNKKGLDDLTSSLLGNGTKNISKDNFNEEIDFLGANVNFNSRGVYANSLSKSAFRILELMADGVLNPNFTQEEFNKEKAKISESLKSDEKSVTAIAARVTNALAFGKSHPFGEFTTQETLNNVSLADVEANYKNSFVPQNAYFIIIGDVSFNKIKPLVEKLFGSWEKKAVNNSVFEEPKNSDATEIYFIDMPNAVQSEIALVNTVNLKMTEPDFFPAILANNILGGDFNSYLMMNLREKNAWTYDATSSLGFGKYVSKLKSASAVRNMVTDSAVVEMIKEIKRIRTDKVSDELLNSIKASFVGKFVMQVQQPQAIARYALKIETENLPKDFYENYIKSINAVTPEQVQMAANKYFLIDNTKIVIAGKASDVIPGLENLQIPINYVDKFANPVEKPIIKKEVPAGMTAKIVLDNYIKAIGGEKAVSAVKTISMLGSTTIPQAQAPLSFVSKIDAKGKLLVELAMGTMSLMKQVVNEKGGYLTQQGQRKNMEGADLTEMKASATPFEELKLAKKTDLILTGIESINGNEAYAIQNGKTTLFYHTATGLKLAETKTVEQAGNKTTQTTNYGDYKEVKGVKVPFNIIQNVGFELDIKLSEVKINEGMTDADFQ